LPALTQYLACGTAQLPKVELSATPRAIGRNTVESIQGGCLLGYCGLVRGILSSIQQELGYKPYVVATGGDAKFLSTYLPEIDVVDPLLTFRGLNALASLLF
jgi:type III pantothenate kinase